MSTHRLNSITDYDNAPFGASLKQADVTLMGYPLQYPMPRDVMLNDLLYEVRLTDSVKDTMHCADGNDILGGLHEHQRPCDDARSIRYRLPRAG